MTKSLTNLLTHALSQNNITCSADEQHKLVQYLELMQRWNKVFNLTTITEPEEMVYLHLIDSLLMQSFLQGKHIVDVGSGAGVPGIPLAIMNPHIQWTLVDKNNKKTRFMTQAVAELKLSNITVINDRSEHVQTETSFDTILSRAYGSISMFITTTAHLLAPGGSLVAMKGKYPEEELSDIPEHFVIEKTVPIAIKGIKVERCVVVLKRKL